jgi:hypothetical protein
MGTRGKRSAEIPSEEESFTPELRAFIGRKEITQVIINNFYGKFCNQSVLNKSVLQHQQHEYFTSTNTHFSGV